jgi:HD superfamily phosphohydrolase
MNSENKEITLSQPKLIGCNIHKSITVQPLILKVIQTKWFQRLHNIKQLGLCYFVFPCAKHTRFEHALGTYHLAKLLIKKIQEKYPNRDYWIEELGVKSVITDRIARCIEIAALCHDIGHGPFSHCFDDVILEGYNHPNSTHEVRSCLIVEMICKNLEFQDKEISFIKSLINPSSPKHCGVIYQIVSNTLNGMDVDKYDYLKRDSYNLGLSGFDATRLLEEFIIDSNDNIAYSKHFSHDVLKMFSTRHELHSIVYGHKTTKIIESMYADMWRKVEPIFKIREYVTDMNLFCKLHDNTLFDFIEQELNPPCHLELEINDQKELKDLKEAYQIYQNILSRKLYKSIFCQNDIGDQVAQTFIDQTLQLHPELKKEMLELVHYTVGYVSPKKPDPFLSIYFYDKDENKTFTLDKTTISSTLSKRYYEDRYLLICKDREIAPMIKNEWTIYYQKILDERKHNEVESKIREAVIDRNPELIKDIVNDLVKSHVNQNGEQLIKDITTSSLKIINEICKASEEIKKSIK